MSSVGNSQQLVFQGEVIEIVEQGQEKLIKVSLFPCSIDVPVHSNVQPRLGDIVSMEATVKVQHVERVVPID